MRWLADRIWLNLKSRYHFRRSFWMHAFLMLVNDFLWVLILSLLFTGVGDIGGLSRSEYLATYSYAMLVFGTVMFPFGGVRKLWEKIADGSLDRLMLTPRSSLLNTVTSEVNISALGDLMAGTLGLLFFRPPLRLLLFLPASALVFFSFMLITNSLHFFVEDYSGKLQHHLWIFVLTGGMWPVMLLPQPLRFMAYYVFPGGTIFFYAVEQAFAGGWAPQLWLLAAIFPLVALILWKLGLKRYTSTGLGINVRA